MSRNRMDERELRLLKKSIYGRDLFYPDCERSEFFCRLAGSRTVSRKMIDLLRAEGFRLTYKIESADGKDLNHWIEEQEVREEQARSAKEEGTKEEGGVK